MSIVPQYFEIREVGKTIKSTKKQYIWRFKLENKDYTIELYTSVLSGKKKILQNGQVIYFDSKFKSAFQFPFSIGRNALNLVQHGDKYELRINNQSFTHLWDNERTKRNFVYDKKDEVNHYQAKDYGKHYEESIGSRSNPSNNLRPHEDRRREERAEQKNHKSVNIDNEFQMSEEELALQKQMYEEIQKQNKAKQQQERKHSAQPKNDDRQINRGDFSTGFDHGFGKFDTNAQNAGQKVQGSSSIPKKNEDFFANYNEERKDNNQFNFDFSNNNKQQPSQQQNQPQAQKQQPDLFDLLGSTDPVQQQQNNAGGAPAMDFFNDLDFKSSDISLPQQNPQSQQQQQQQVQDLFGDFDNSGQNANAFGQQVQQPPVQQQQQPQPEESKPKFMPNLNSFYTQNTMMNSQAAMMQQQQQQMMMQMMMGGQNQYQTQMNPSAGGMYGTNYNNMMNPMAPMGGQQQPMGGQQQQFNNMGSGGLGGGMNQNFGGQGMDFGGSNLGGGMTSQQQPQFQQHQQYNTAMQGGYPQQQQDQFGGQQQQQQQYNQYQTSYQQPSGYQDGNNQSSNSNNASTPFDLFA